MNLIEAYRKSHQHPMNRACHTVGIPLVVCSIILFFFHWKLALVLFIVGWVFQFVGHAFEGKPPAFFSNPVFLIVGPIWWFKKIFCKDKKSI